MLHKEFNNGLRAYLIHQAVQPMGSTAIYRLEKWRDKGICGIDAALKERQTDPVQAEFNAAISLRAGEWSVAGAVFTFDQKEART